MSENMPKLQELKERDQRLSEEMADALKRAQDDAPDCDAILILMQRKDGGIIYKAMPSMRIETMSYLATGFLHGFHGMTLKP